MFGRGPRAKFVEHAGKSDGLTTRARKLPPRSAVATAQRVHVLGLHGSRSGPARGERLANGPVERGPIEGLGQAEDARR